ncbi:MAG TPA: hypothetical protein VF714_11600, partial [Jatrophihabitans sp.]
SPEVLRLAEDTLTGPDAADLAPPARRALVDGTDALRRAVRSLQRYPGSGKPGRTPPARVSP